MQETLASKSSDNLELYFDDNNFAQILYGELNKNLKEIEKLYSIKIHSKGNKINLKGDDSNTKDAKHLILELYNLINKGYVLQSEDISIAKRLLSEKNRPLEEVFLDTICISVRKKLINPKTINQKLYITLPPDLQTKAI